MSNAPSPDPRRRSAAELRQQEQARASVDRLLAPEEREAVVARLSAAFAQDVLPLEEFERRVTEVYRAASPAALARLTEDLPGGSTAASSGVSGGRALVQARPMATRVVAIFSSVERTGRVAVPPRLEIRSLFGNVELDLRDAEFGPGVTEISVHSVFGNVEVQLPPHVGVEDHGVGIFGSFAARRRSPAGRAPFAAQPAPTTAVVRITGHAVLGNVEFESDAEGGGGGRR